MDALSLIGRMTAAKFDALRHPTAKPARTPAPWGLTQGATIQAPVAAMVVAQAAGAVVPDVDPHLTVTSVGVMRALGSVRTRSYLSDGRSYVETVSDPRDPAKCVQARLYVLHTERMPSTDDEWAFLLGADARTMRDTNTCQDVVVAEAVPALIGWPAFQLEDAARGSVQYPRSWEPGGGPTGPVEIQETVTCADGLTFEATHLMMAYGRLLDDSTTPEHLVAEVIRTEDAAAFNAAVGLDVTAADLSILPPPA